MKPLLSNLQGMVDADEEISSTLKREFTEEAINSLREEDKEGTLKAIQNLFKSGKVVIYHWTYFQS